MTTTDSQNTSQPPNRPGVRKAFCGSLGGAAATIFASLLSQNGIAVSDEMFGAISTAVMAIVMYLTRETYS